MARSHAGDPVAADALLDAVKNERNLALRTVLVDGRGQKAGRAWREWIEDRKREGRVHCVEVI